MRFVVITASSIPFDRSSAEGQRPVAVLRREVVHQVGEPRGQGGELRVVGREAAAEPETVLRESRRKAACETKPEREREPEEREDGPRDDRRNGEHAGALDERQHDERQTRHHPDERGEREAPESCSADLEPLAATGVPEPGSEHPEERPRPRLRLEEPEEVLARPDPVGKCGELREPAALASVLRRRSGGRRDRARRRPTDVHEAIGPGDLAESVGVDDTARDAALHHDVAQPSRLRVVVRPRVAGHPISSSSTGSISVFARAL